MKMQQTILILLLAFISVLGLGQDTTGGNWRLFPSHKEIKHENKLNFSTLNFDKPNGKVEVYKDARITKIENQLRESPYIYGYTLQLEVSQQKNVIQDARYRILKISPNIEIDDPYESPNIYLYAGRFYDRVSAYEFKKQISDYFPNAIVVGPKKMDLPRIQMPDPAIEDSVEKQIEDPRSN